MMKLTIHVNGVADDIGKLDLINDKLKALAIQFNCDYQMVVQFQSFEASDKHLADPGR